MENKNPKLEFINLISILLSITVAFLGSIFVVYGKTTLKELSMTLILISIVQLILYIIYKIKNPKFTKIEIILYTLFIFTGLSLIGTNNLDISIWGGKNRCEGLFMIYSYYIIALITSTLQDKTYKNFIINYIIIIGLTNFIYGLFQIGIINTDIIDIKQKWKYARGFQGNSMYYSSLISICYFLVVGKYLFTKNKYNIILIIIFTIASTISGSMGLLISTIFIYILLIIYKLIKKSPKETYKKIFICISIFILISALFQMKEHKYNKDIKQLTNEMTTAMKTGKIDSSFGTGRIYIWKNVLGKVKENPIFGIGIDNIHNSFNPPLIDKISKLPVDKAHNEYLQKTVCEGIISGIAYILFLILIALSNYKEPTKTKKILLLAFLAYTIQAFFNISVIRVSPLFWIIIGLLLNNTEQLKTKNFNQKVIS